MKSRRLTRSPHSVNSWRLDARRLDDRPPFLCFGLLQRAEDVGSLLVARRNFLANVGEPLPHRGIRQGFNNCSIEMGYDGTGCAFDHPQAETDGNYDPRSFYIVHVL